MLSDAQLFTWNLILPFILIGAVSAFLPLWLARNMAENWGALALNALICVTICYSVGAGYFFFEYNRQGVPWHVLISLDGLGHVLRVTALSALFWGPILTLMLLTRPQTWRPDL